MALYPGSTLYPSSLQYPDTDLGVTPPTGGTPGAPGTLYPAASLYPGSTLYPSTLPGVVTPGGGGTPGGTPSNGGSGGAVNTPEVVDFYFIPPVTYTGPTTVPDKHPGNALFRHFGPRAEGVNVYLMPGNVITEQTPASDLDAVRVYHGGHIHPITTAEATLLVAAGYSVVVPS